VIVALIPATIARSKGRPFGPWWVLGFLLLPFAIIAAVVIGPSDRCPFCREAIQHGATVCPHCRTSLVAPATTAVQPPG
jgi:hypothetical protein